MDKWNQEDIPVQTDEEAGRLDEDEIDEDRDDLNHIPDFEEIERRHSRES